MVIHFSVGQTIITYDQGHILEISLLLSPTVEEWPWPNSLVYNKVLLLSGGQNPGHLASIIGWGSKNYLVSHVLQLLRLIVMDACVWLL